MAPLARQPAERSSSSASWAPASRGRCGPRGRRARGGRRRPSCSSESSGCRSPTSSPPEGEAEFRAPRGGWWSRLLERAGGEAIALGGGSVLSERVRERARAARRRLARADADDAWERVEGRRGRWPATARGSTALHAERAPIYESLADAIVPGGATPPRRALPAAASAASSCPPGRGWPGRERLGRLPGVRRARPGRRATGRSTAEPILRHRRQRRAAVRRPGVGPRTRRIEVPAGRAGEDLERGRAGPARARRARRDPLGPRRRARWRRRRRPRRVLRRRSTSAASRSSRCRRRSSPRSTPPTAARPASTFPRRRTTSAPTTCRRRCSPTRRRSTTLPAAELAAGFVEVLKTGADRRRCALGAGARARSTRPGELDELVFACARTKLEVVAADERDSGAPPVAQPRPHRRPRDRGGDRISALPPRRGGRARAARGAAALRAPTDCADEVARPARPPRAADGARPPSIDVDEVMAAVGRDKKRDLGGARVRALLGAGPRSVRAAGRSRIGSGRRCRSCVRQG